MGTATRDDHDDQALLPFEGENGDEKAARFIRRQWHEGRWFFSVIDVVGLLTDSPDPGNYWASLKRRVQDEGFAQVVTHCHRLKMRSLDGKMRETDAADVDTLLRIVQSIPSPKAEPVKQWLARVGGERLEAIAEADALAGLNDAQRRLFIRGQLADQNIRTADSAKLAGVVSTRDFAIFQDWGSRGLYAGETARDIAARKGLPRGEPILDWMNASELAANLFRATQTEEKLRREGIQGKAEAGAAHLEVGRKVRQTIAELGGTMPEDQPTPAESIRQLQAREQQRVEAERQPPLFPEPENA